MDAERVCVLCGAVLVRRPTEWPNEYRKRQTCGGQCRAKLAGRRRREAVEAPAPKTCPVCGAEFGPRDDEPAWQYRKRKTCSRPCATVQTGRNGRVKLAPKQCEVCGKLFERKPSQKTNEFRSRTVCSYECRNKKISASKYIDPPARQCVICGAPVARRPGEPMCDFRKRKTCSNDCRWIAQTRTMEAHFLESDQFTTIEQDTYAALDRLGIRYETQHAIGRYRVDAYLPDRDVVVECFGNYWHGPDRPAQQFRDQRKLTALRRAVSRVVVLWEADIKERGAETLLREALGITTQGRL